VGKLCVQRKRIMLAPLTERSLEGPTIAAAEKGVTLQSAVETVGTVLADEHWIEQDVGNLVSNALKFTPAGGRITVSLPKAGAVARLVVADSGEGIARDFIPQVFEAFSHAKGLCVPAYLWVWDWRLSSIWLTRMSVGSVSKVTDRAGDHHPCRAAPRKSILGSRGDPRH
jgi:hypothetical protein